MLKITLCFLLMICWQTSVTAQNDWLKNADELERVGHIHFMHFRHSESVAAYELAYLEHARNKSLMALPIGHKIGFVLMREEKLDSALIWADKMRALGADSGVSWAALFADLVEADVYARRKEPAKSKAILDKILAIAEHIEAKDTQSKQLLSRLNYLIAKALIGIKQVAVAELYLKKAEDICLELKETSSFFYGKMLELRFNFIVSAQLFTPENLMQISYRLATISSNLGEEGWVLKNVSFNAAYLSAYLGSDTSAILKIFDNQERFYIAQFGLLHPETGLFYINIGAAYKDVWRGAVGNANAEKRLPSVLKSIALSKKGLKILEEGNLSSVHQNVISSGYRNIGYVMLEEIRDYFPLDSIELYFHKAYEALLSPEHRNLGKGNFPDFSDYTVVTYSDLPTIRALQGVISIYHTQYEKGNLAYKPYLLNAYKARAALIARQSIMMQSADDKKIMEAYMAELNRDKFNSFFNFWQQEGGQAYADSMLYYVEQMSGAATRRNLDMAATLAQAGVSDTLAQQYIAQSKRIEALAAQRASAQRERKTDLARQLNDQLIKEQLVMTRIDNDIQSLHPTYAKAMLGFSVPNIAEIQALLNPQTAYYIPLVNWSSFIICKDTFFHSPQPPHDTDFGGLQAWTAQLGDPNFEQDSFVRAKIDYALNAHKIYTLIFSKAELLQKRQINHLIAVSNLNIPKFPLELLLCSPPDTNANYADFDYLLKHYIVQYVPSLSLWQQARQLASTANSNGKILAYAPIYDKGFINPNRTGNVKNLRRALSPLRGAQEEVAGLKNIYYGDYRLGTEANELSFKKQLQEGYTIIHLAMHGLFNDKAPETSALAFSETLDTTEDNFLEAYEIGIIKSNAQLVVLSACETAVGQQQVGEGTMSIARYFLYGGTPALIATRWQVNDQTTAIIMQEFYRNMYNGTPVHEALRQAQLLYLANAKGNAQHPFFWAPYMSIGYTDRPIAIAHKNWALKYYIGIPATLIVLLTAGLLYRRRQKKYEV